MSAGQPFDALAEIRRQLSVDVFERTGEKVSPDDPIVTAALVQSRVARDAAEAIREASAGVREDVALMERRLEVLRTESTALAAAVLERAGVEALRTQAEALTVSAHRMASAGANVAAQVELIARQAAQSAQAYDDARAALAEAAKLAQNIGPAVHAVAQSAEALRMSTSRIDQGLSLLQSSWRLPALLLLAGVVGGAAGAVVSWGVG